jgi:hypothetical protein
MVRVNRSSVGVFFLMLTLLIVADARVGAQTEKDPHRPPCTDASCRKIRLFLKKHYCGESPAGNGPDDSCDLRDRNKRSADVKVIADYNCEWNATKEAAECTQHGQVTLELRGTLVHELRQLGLPAEAPGETYFTVLQSDRAGWSLAQAYYSHRIGSDIELCEVVAVIDRNGLAFTSAALRGTEKHNPQRARRVQRR